MARIAAIQMCSTDRVEENLDIIKKWMLKAVSLGAELIVLPENVGLMGHTEEDKLKIAELPNQGPLQDFFSTLARELKVWVIGGTLPIKTQPTTTSQLERGRVYASCFVWNNLGQSVARYDKIHLFDVQVQPDREEYRESRTICPGKNTVCIDSPFGKLGLSICYDLRFPELYRKLLREGAEILIIPAAFTAITGKAHWEILLRARAIENFSYVVAANQWGLHRNNRATWGHSMIIDPWGIILDSLPEGDGVVMADIDLNYLHELRSRFPVAEHRRIF